MFDGRLHAQKLEKIIVDFVDKKKPLAGELVIIQVGDNAVSEKYINLKMKLCEKLGIPVILKKINSELPDDAILHEIKQIMDSTTCAGCIIQMPLPRLSLNSALDLIPLSKDIDMLSSKSMDQYSAGNFQKLPPVVRAVQYFINEYDIDLHEKTVTVIGYGQIVGMPIAHYLKSLGAKIAILDNYKTGTPLKSELVLLSAGVPNLVNGQDIAPGSSIIDFGSSVVAGKTIGDLNMHSDLNHLLNISPSPGGMGPLVVRFLVMNFLKI